MGNLYITVEEFMKQIGSSHVDIEPSDIVNIGLHFILKNVRPYAAPCSEA